MSDSGSLVNNFDVVKICENISVNTLIGISRKIPGDEFIIVNMFRIWSFEIASNKDGDDAILIRSLI